VNSTNPLISLVPEGRIELPRTQGPLDFESGATIGGIQISVPYGLVMNVDNPKHLIYFVVKKGA